MAAGGRLWREGRVVITISLALPPYTHMRYNPGLDFVPVCHLLGLRRKGRRSQLVSMAFLGLPQNALLLLLPLSHPESSWKAGPLG